MGSYLSAFSLSSALENGYLVRMEEGEGGTHSHLTEILFQMTNS